MYFGVYNWILKDPQVGPSQERKNSGLFSDLKVYIKFNIMDWGFLDKTTQYALF